jgi:hypothetical protein
MPPRQRATTAKSTRTKAQSPREERIEAFEEFRRRAQRSPLSTARLREVEPYVLGPDKGFDPPIAIAMPTGLVELSAFDQAWRASDPFSMLRILLGSEYLRVLRAFDTQPDAMDLLSGLAMAVTDHFLGQGASDVPGGSRAS